MVREEAEGKEQRGRRRIVRHHLLAVELTPSVGKMSLVRDGSTCRKILSGLRSTSGHSLSLDEALSNTWKTRSRRG
jgi:hypothetical protein